MTLIYGILTHQYQMAEFEMDKELHMGAKIECFEVGIY